MIDRMEQLLLDDSLDIDQKATANNVRNFLAHNFNHLLNIAGLEPSNLSVVDESHISSPKMDITGVSAHGMVNHTIDNFNRIMEADKACHAIYRTIMNCRNGSKQPYKTILAESYLHNVEDFKIQAMLCYSSSQYDILKRRALCEFADRWDKWKNVYGVEYMSDLHVHRKKQNRLQTGYRAEIDRKSVGY